MSVSSAPSVPAGFRASADLHAVYSAAEPTLRPVIRRLAKRWSDRGAGEVDDLVQDGSAAILAALGKYDHRRANLRTYAAGILQRAYSKALRDRLRHRRTPRIWQRSEEGWALVPCATVSLDAPHLSNRDRHETSDGPQKVGDRLRDDGADPEACAVQSGTQRESLAFVARHLSEFQREVLRLYLRPSPGLLAVARNLSGTYDVTLPHLAAYLGVPFSRVDYAMRQVRKTVVALDEQRRWAGAE